MIQLVGFTGSALIVMSVTMRSVARLRAFALVGSTLFVVYGALLGAWPVVMTNVVTTGIHLHRLHALSKLEASAL